MRNCANYSLQNADAPMKTRTNYKRATKKKEEREEGKNESLRRDKDKGSWKGDTEW